MVLQESLEPLGRSGTYGALDESVNAIRILDLLAQQRPDPVQVEPERKSIVQ